jgi:hypothetical protein
MALQFFHLRQHLVKGRRLLGQAIVTAIFQTNSTGVLAPLNGMIAVGTDEISPTDESHITLWKWESGIPLSALAPSTNGTISTTANSTTTTAE